MNRPQPTTPAPPTDDHAAINRAIAEALGWTHLMHNQSGNWHGVNNGVREMLPDYAGDYGEALRLLETVLNQIGILSFDIGLCTDGEHKYYCEVYGTEQNFPERADTLPAAIAKACLAALRAIAEGE